MEINRLDFAQEMMLRKTIRKGIKVIAERKKLQILEEKNFIFVGWNQSFFFPVNRWISTCYRT